MNLEQVKYGAIRYIRDTMVPRLTGGRRIAMGAYANLLVDRKIEELQKLLKYPFIAVLCIQDENGLIDLERVRSAVLPMMETEKIDLPIPVIGLFTLDKNDVDKLCRYIQEA